MAQETKGKPIRIQTIALLAVIIVLAGGFAYSYVSMSNRISTVCQQVTSISLNYESLLNNMTLTLQSQMNSDNSLIQTLNSTRPAGYTEMIATLKSQITQDLSLIDYYAAFVAQVAPSSMPRPCS